MQQPITSGALVRAHGNVTSDAMNNQWDDTYYSLYDLYQQVNQGAINGGRIIAFLQSELAAVSQQISTLSNQSGNIVSARNMVATYPNPSQDSSDTSFRCFIDQQSNVVTLPLNGSPIPKTYAYDIFRQQTYVGSDTQVVVGTETQKNFVSDNPLWLVDPNQPFWAGTISDSVNNMPDQEVLSIEVDLSTQVIDDFQANTIVYIPHPLYTMSISDLQYNLTGTWNAIPGFTALSNITACRWCFTPINAINYRFTLAQPTYVTQGGQAVFTFGGQQFGVYYQPYQSTGIVFSEFTITPGSTISSVIHSFANTEDPSFGVTGSSFTTPQSFFSYEIFTEGPSGLLTYLPNWSNVNSSTVWVKTTLNMVNGASPALVSVELDVA
jgi:hypothetical protein